MSTASSYYFRRRRLGRAASPPTWACYEQIRQYDEDSYGSSDDDDSFSSHSFSDVEHNKEHESGSKQNSDCSDDEDYHNVARQGTAIPMDGDNSDCTPTSTPRKSAPISGIGSDDIDMDMDMTDSDDSTRGRPTTKKDVKGKGKAVNADEVPGSQTFRSSNKEMMQRRERRKQTKRREPVYSLRPILTIHKSQGFVWNQDLFVPPYIKDRYIASTSPPNSKGFIPTSPSSSAHGDAAAALSSTSNEYEAVEVVEIRIGEGELKELREIIP